MRSRDEAVIKTAPPHLIEPWYDSDIGLHLHRIVLTVSASAEAPDVRIIPWVDWSAVCHGS